MRCRAATSAAFGDSTACGAPCSSRTTEKSSACIRWRAVSAGKSFRQASFAAKRAARLATRPAPVPASASFLWGKEPLQVLCWSLVEEALDPSEFDAVNAAAIRRGAVGRDIAFERERRLR